MTDKPARDSSPHTTNPRLIGGIDPFLDPFWGIKASFEIICKGDSCILVEKYIGYY
jgi:hypothetical protein